MDFSTRKQLGDINNCTDTLDIFTTSQYLCACSLVKTWIICAYAICRLTAATTDMANTLFAMGRMGWCFTL
ncbi:hypothetical protein K492DRAFT_170728, partial [Lichtheimia hyalospora FSU 10163]